MSYIHTDGDVVMSWGLVAFHQDIGIMVRRKVHPIGRQKNESRAPKKINITMIQTYSNHIKPQQDNKIRL